MLPNKVFALECRKKYEEQGLIVDKRNGQFAHCPLPKGMGDEGLYLLWGDHQHQGLLQSRDVGRRCFWAADVKRWLDGFPEGFFELYGIYEEFISGEHGPRFGVPHTEEWKKAMSERMSGENHPMYGRTGKNHPQFGVPRTEEQKKAQSEKMSGRYSGENHPNYGNTGALNPRSKAIITIQPDGTQQHYGGVREAARELGIGHSDLSKYLKTGKSPTRGKFKEWRFIYENPEVFH